MESIPLFGVIDANYFADNTNREAEK